MGGSKWNPKLGDYKKTNASIDKKRLIRKTKIHNSLLLFLAIIIFLLLLFSIIKF